MKVHCALCDLFLGEAEQAVKIVCPLCLEVRHVVRFIVEQGPKPDWYHEVMQMDILTRDLVKELMTSYRLCVPEEPVIFPDEELYSKRNRTR